MGGGGRVRVRMHDHQIAPRIMVRVRVRVRGRLRTRARTRMWVRMRARLRLELKIAPFDHPVGRVVKQRPLRCNGLVDSLDPIHARYFKEHILFYGTTARCVCVCVCVFCSTIRLARCVQTKIGNG